MSKAPPTSEIAAERAAIARYIAERVATGAIGTEARNELGAVAEAVLAGRCSHG